RHSRSFGIAVVDHPAARIALIILAALVIDVSRLVGADLLAVPPRIEARIEVLAVPPGKYLRENGLHRFLRQDSRRQGRYGSMSPALQGLRPRLACDSIGPDDRPLQYQMPLAIALVFTHLRKSLRLIEQNRTLVGFHHVEAHRAGIGKAAFDLV